MILLSKPDLQLCEARTTKRKPILHYPSMKYLGLEIFVLSAENLANKELMVCNMNGGFQLEFVYKPGYKSHDQL